MKRNASWRAWGCLLVFSALCPSALSQTGMSCEAAKRHNISEIEKAIRQTRQAISAISTGGSPYQNPTYGAYLRQLEAGLKQVKGTACPGEASGKSDEGMGSVSDYDSKAKSDPLRAQSHGLLASLADDGGGAGDGAAGDSGGGDMPSEEEKRRQERERLERLKQQAQQEGYPAKDPAQNWSGSPCHFFTCPYERRDRNDNMYGYNSYANESVVRYGRWQYTCVAGRWKVSGSASGPVDAARADASVGEMKCQNKYGAPLDSVFMYEGE